MVFTVWCMMYIRALRALTRSAVSYMLPSHSEEESFSAPVMDFRDKVDDADPYAAAYFDGEAYARLCHTIANAQKNITIRMFIWKGDSTGREVAKLLVDAANRGVFVDIRKDMLGDMFELSKDFAGTRSESDDVWKEFWNHPRISIHHKNFHDHSKMFIIDDTLLIGTMNIGDDDCRSWRECFVELRGISFIESAVTGLIGEKNSAISVLRSSARSPMRSRICDLIDSATSSILMVASYFSDEQCIELLAQKSRKGITVSVVIPDYSYVHHHANIFAVTQLLKRGNPNHIHIYRHTEALLHAKILIVDRQTVCVGSTNFTTHSLSHMGEANVLFRNAPQHCIDAIQSVVEHMMRRSKTVTALPGAQLFHRSLGFLQL